MMWAGKLHLHLLIFVMLPQTLEQQRLINWSTSDILELETLRKKEAESAFSFPLYFTVGRGQVLQSG